jgi:hypothetical protein
VDLNVFPSNAFVKQTGRGGEYYSVAYDISMFKQGELEFSALYEGEVLGHVECTYS